MIHSCDTVVIISKNIESLKLSNKFNSFEEERGGGREGGWVPVEILALFPTKISPCSPLFPSIFLALFPCSPQNSIMFPCFPQLTWSLVSPQRFHHVPPTNMLPSSLLFFWLCSPKISPCSLVSPSNMFPHSPQRFQHVPLFSHKDFTMFFCSPT